MTSPMTLVTDESQVNFRLIAIINLELPSTVYLLSKEQLVIEKRRQWRFYIGARGAKPPNHEKGRI